ISNRAPLADTLEAIVSTARELLGGRVADVYMRDPDDPLLLRTATGETSIVGQGATGRAVAEGRLVVVEESLSTMAAPVHEQGEIAGALVVAAPEPGRTYARSDQDVLLTLAEHASL